MQDTWAAHHAERFRYAVYDSIITTLRAYSIFFGQKWMLARRSGMWPRNGLAAPNLDTAP